MLRRRVEIATNSGLITDYLGKVQHNVRIGSRYRLLCTVVRSVFGGVCETHLAGKYLEGPIRLVHAAIGGFNLFPKLPPFVS